MSTLYSTHAFSSVSRSDSSVLPPIPAFLLTPVALAALYWLIDVYNYKRATPFFVTFGMNSISAYVLADIVPGLMGAIKMTYNGQPTNLYGYIYQTTFVPFFSPVNASLAAAIALVLLLWAIMYPLYKYKIIIKV